MVIRQSGCAITTLNLVFQKSKLGRGSLDSRASSLSTQPGASNTPPLHLAAAVRTKDGLASFENLVLPSALQTSLLQPSSTSCSPSSDEVDKVFDFPKVESAVMSQDHDISWDDRSRSPPLVRPKAAKYPRDRRAAAIRLPKLRPGGKKGIVNDIIAQEDGNTSSGCKAGLVKSLCIHHMLHKTNQTCFLLC